MCISHGFSYAETATGRDSYEVASHELGGYCIERLCLGMTIQKVAALGTIKWLGDKAPDGKIKCVKGPTISATGELATADGKAFHIRFELVNPSGNSESRYRLIDAQIMLSNVTLLQIDHLAQTLKSRYGPMRDFTALGSGPVTVSTADSKSGLFSIAVTRIWEPVYGSMKVGLSADYKKEADWVLTLTDCKAGLPKL